MPVVIGRREFCEFYFVYLPGEHVVFIGPTQRGKTTLAFQLLEFCATPAIPAYVAVSKPKDPVSIREAKRLGYRRVSDWPPKATLTQIWADKPSGYLIYPKFGDINKDMVNCAEVTTRLIESRYTAGVKDEQGILVLDDTMVKAQVMGLDRQMKTVLAMAGAMNLGEWIFVQKTTDSGSTAIWGYNNSEHLFLLKDPDSRNRRRYGEIGGVDPGYVEYVTQKLKPYQFLYIKRTPLPGTDESPMCIVDAA